MSPGELLQRLIRFDTTNPPGNEAECIDFVRGLLEEAGVDTEVYAKVPGRPNLVARLPGGDKPPLLLQGHVDVVTTSGQNWTRPPFGGELVDGYIWGRGAVDMKGPVAMLVSAFLRAKQEGTALPGDVILALLADEEAGGDMGARFLAEEHAHLFEGVRYALSEFGGFSLEIAGRRFYPIQVAEKQICWLKAIVRGRAGHAALVNRGGTMARLGRLLRDLDRRRLPVHVTPAADAGRLVPARYRAGGDHGVGQRRGRGARPAEQHPLPGVKVHGRDPGVAVGPAPGVFRMTLLQRADQ